MEPIQGSTRPVTRCLLGVTACAACLGFATIGWANHERVEYHFDDFNTVGWSSGSTSTIPGYSGGVFLGEFGVETVSLFILDALPGGDDPKTWESARCVTVSFDILTIGTWLGNSGSLFWVTANGQELTLTSFASPGLGLDQAYPGEFPDDSFPAGTGAVELFGQGTVYHLDLTFPLFWQEPCCTDIVIEFSAAFPPVAASWGLDNVIVDWSQLLPCPAPCPADLDGDGTVGILDLLALLAAWGAGPVGPPDFDGDGTVGILDLLTLLGNGLHTFGGTNAQPRRLRNPGRHVLGLQGLLCDLADRG